jgi:glycosyltransferase involved in cell wall biosynthesis
MKIMQILPEFEEGGVERHVLWLSNELASRGHEVTVVSAGGKLENQLDGRVKHRRLPVHLKNPATAAWCALKIARFAGNDKYDLMHAHSRVPAWITWWASSIAKTPWIITAHDNYRKNRAIYPFRYADTVICVSRSVKEHLEGFIPKESHVIYNGLPVNYAKWAGPTRKGPKRLLFLGRITRRKGLQVVLEVLGDFGQNDWILDVVGDGPLRGDLENMALELGIAEKVRFHGFRDDTEEWMKRCDCFLFPSLEEGMGLTLMQAVYMGVPVLASDLPPVRELASDGGQSLVPAGDTKAWKERIANILSREDNFSSFDRSKVLTVKETCPLIEEVYSEILRKGHSHVTGNEKTGPAQKANPGESSSQREEPHGRI